MKNRITIIFLIAAVSLLFKLFLCCPCLFASSNDAGLSISVGVNSVFSIKVSPTSLDFGSADPGAVTPTKTVVIECVTNNNNQWIVQISDAAELTAGVYTIANGEFNWWGSSNGSGYWNPGTAKMSVEPQTFYTAASDEYITTAPVVLTVNLNVDIPNYQPAGTYVTTIEFTMCEQ
ncbi:MAG: hypothetical protein V1933_05775 [Candidatus Omnitrophota bacterium]